MTNNKTFILNNLLDSYCDFFIKLPDTGMSFYNKIQTTVLIAAALEKTILAPDSDPLIYIQDVVKDQIELLKNTSKIVHELNKNENILTEVIEQQLHTKKLFESAWTTYSEETYDHSVKLIIDRLIHSGFDQNWFKGKTCFDGGCGTGRFSVAMSLLGAKEILALDVGKNSLKYLESVTKRYNIKNITFFQQDITDLSNFDSNKFDFVASNGVLHHTLDCINGLKDHYRITKHGGVFWLYLYGAGGIYWSIYDTLKSLVKTFKVEIIKNTLEIFNLREGFIYTYLDNILAHRSYHSEKDILTMLSQLNKLSFKYQQGPSIFDNPSMYLKTPYGRDILGPEGEIRLIINKI